MLAASIISFPRRSTARSTVKISAIAAVTPPSSSGHAFCCWTFVLANLAYDYFETEHDKLHFFCDELGIPKESTPALRRTSQGAIDARTHVALFRR